MWPEASCVNHGKDSRVMADDEPEGTSSAWVGGMAVGIF